MPGLVRLENVSKSFDANKVIDGLSLELEEGEVLGVIGPNGAGKTTMFNLITGDLRPSEGSIYLGEQDITKSPAYVRCRLGIGRSYQIPHPFVNMTVFENVLVGAAFGTGKAESKCYDHCIELLTHTNLLAKANVPAGRLTLLERKRLELARALATRPRVLLLDEIAGGLTEGECRDLVGAIKDLHASGMTIIWIEHVVHALLAVVSRLIVMNFGRMLAEGTPHVVMNDPIVQEVYMGIDAR
jgi:branched-chain amino acid transport system ATP-binding protein